MILDELKRQNRSSAWLAKQLGNCRTNGHKITHEKKFNDIHFLIDVSLILNHNFFRDITETLDEKMNTNSVQSE